MIHRISYFIIITLLTHFYVKGQMVQDLEVYEDSNQVILRGIIDHSIVKTGEDAYTVIQYGIDQLKEDGGSIKIRFL